MLRFLTTDSKRVWKQTENSTSRKYLDYFKNHHRTSETGKVDFIDMSAYDINFLRR